MLRVKNLNTLNQNILSRRSKCCTYTKNTDVRGNNTSTEKILLNPEVCSLIMGVQRYWKLKKCTNSLLLTCCEWTPVPCRRSVFSDFFHFFFHTLLFRNAHMHAHAPTHPHTHAHTHGRSCQALLLYPLKGEHSLKVQYLGGVMCFPKSMKSGALLFRFCSPFIKAEHRSSLEKSLKLTRVRLSWHSAFVAAGQGQLLWTPAFLCSLIENRKFIPSNTGKRNVVPVGRKSN